MTPPIHAPEIDLDLKFHIQISTSQFQDRSTHTFEIRKFEHKRGQLDFFGQFLPYYGGLAALHSQNIIAKLSLQLPLAE